jgi:hypothetical protein
MEVVREIHPAQHIHLLDVSCTSRLEFMAPDGTVRRELPSRKQVSTLFPLMDPWEIMASSLSLNLSRNLVIWVNPSAPFFLSGAQVLFILSTRSFPLFLLFSLCYSWHPSPQLPQNYRSEPSSRLPGPCVSPLSFSSPRLSPLISLDTSSIFCTSFTTHGFRTVSSEFPRISKV